MNEPAIDPSPAPPAGATPSARQPDDPPPAASRTQPLPADVAARVRHARRAALATQHALGHVLEVALDRSRADVVQALARALAVSRRLEAALTALVDPDPDPDPDPREGGEKVSTTEADDPPRSARGDFFGDVSSISPQGAPEVSRAAATDTLSPAAAAIDGAPEAVSGAPEAGSGDPLVREAIAVLSRVLFGDEFVDRYQVEAACIVLRHLGRRPRAPRRPSGRRSDHRGTGHE